MRYIYILDYEKGCCEINIIYNEDPKKWIVSKGYNLNNIHWMITEQPNLFINI